MIVLWFVTGSLFLNICKLLRPEHVQFHIMLMMLLLLRLLLRRLFEILLHMLLLRPCWGSCAVSNLWSIVVLNIPKHLIVFDKYTRVVSGPCLTKPCPYNINPINTCTTTNSEPFTILVLPLKILPCSHGPPTPHHTTPHHTTPHHTHLHCDHAMQQCNEWIWKLGLFVCLKEGTQVLEGQHSVLPISVWKMGMGGTRPTVLSVFQTQGTALTAIGLVALKC